MANCGSPDKDWFGAYSLSPFITQLENTPKPPVAGGDLRDHLAQCLHFRDWGSEGWKGRLACPKPRAGTTAQLRQKREYLRSLRSLSQLLASGILASIHGVAMPQEGTGVVHDAGRGGGRILVLNCSEAFGGGHTLVRT